MRGNLPPPLEKMLESNHGIYDDLACNIRLKADYNIEDVLRLLKQN